jgi:hypothetical protein
MQNSSQITHLTPNFQENLNNNCLNPVAKQPQVSPQIKIRALLATPSPQVGGEIFLFFYFIFNDSKK